MALLHPDGPVAAALEEEREATALGTAAAVAWPAGAVVKAEPVAPGAPPGPAAGPPSLLPPGYEALLAEGEAGGGGEGYSSFSDTDLEEEDPKDAPPDPLLQQNLSAADWQPWPWAPNRVRCPPPHIAPASGIIWLWRIICTDRGVAAPLGCLAGGGR